MATTDQVSKFVLLFNSRYEKSALYSQAVSIEVATAPISPSTDSVTNRIETYQSVFAIKPQKCWSAVFAQGGEEIVLISMRDRLTNELLPYRDLIAEAQRLGLSHPRVFNGPLQDAFAEVDQAEFRLGHEGYVIRIAEWDRYVKLKYPAYREVLRVVNEMRSDRFVRAFMSLARPQRETLWSTLPDDIREQAQQQLERFQQIVERIRDYSAAIRRLAGDDHRSFVELVQKIVPARFHWIIFEEHRSLDATDLLEKPALEVCCGKAELPVTVDDCSVDANAGEFR